MTFQDRTPEPTMVGGPRQRERERRSSVGTESDKFRTFTEGPSPDPVSVPTTGPSPLLGFFLDGPPTRVPSRGSSRYYDSGLIEM